MRNRGSKLEAKLQLYIEGRGEALPLSLIEFRLSWARVWERER